MLRKVELFVLLLLIAAFVLLNKNIGELAASDKVEVNDKVVVLDAGHGGDDPGKVGVNNVLEKEINLKIATKIKEILEEKGYMVIMTREEDKMLLDGQRENKKKEDMKARVELINETKPKLAVSIHQNSYTDPDVSGAQVFYYADSSEGEYYASLVQEALLEIDENNRRQAKANDTYYLLKHTEVPTIIVECGFLSNPEEAKKLSEDEYQDTVSNAIVKGIESCFAN